MGITTLHIHKAAAAGDMRELREIAVLAAAYAASAERQLETTAQGTAFSAVTTSLSVAGRRNSHGGLALTSGADITDTPGGCLRSTGKGECGHARHLS